MGNSPPGLGARTCRAHAPEAPELPPALLPLVPGAQGSDPLRRELGLTFQDVSRTGPCVCSLLSQLPSPAFAARRCARAASQASGAPVRAAACVCPRASPPATPPADRACLSLAILMGGPWCLIEALIYISLMADDLDLRPMSYLPSACIFG